MRLSWPPGVKKLQCTSFVSPKAIPQMQDATQIAQTLLEKHPEVDLFALVPNFRGAQSAVEAGLKTSLTGYLPERQPQPEQRAPHPRTVL